MIYLNDGQFTGLILGWRLWRLLFLESVKFYLTVSKHFLLLVEVCIDGGAGRHRGLIVHSLLLGKLDDFLGEEGPRRDSLHLILVELLSWVLG